MSARPTMAQVAGMFGRRASFPKVVSGCGRTNLRTTGNRTEERVLRFLEENGFTAIPQPTSLFPLDGKGRYTPDFIAWREQSSCILVVEAKGARDGHPVHYPGWEQGIERYQRAAAKYHDGRHWHFAMVMVDQKTGELEIHDWGTGAF